MGEYPELLEKVTTLKSILKRRATGKSYDENDFDRFRSELMTSEIKDRLPKIVRFYNNLDDFWHFIQPKFEHYRERTGYIDKEFELLEQFLDDDNVCPVDQRADTVLSVSNINELWKKALDRRSDDPEGAITAARTLLEATCKNILEEYNIPHSNKDDLPKLYFLVAEQLNLSPAKHSEQLFKQILGGCNL